MARTYKDSPNSKQNRDGGRGRKRSISVRSVRRDPPDLSKLSRAVIALAMAEAEAQAAASEHATESDSVDRPGEGPADGR
jgi:hypothetical protein